MPRHRHADVIHAWAEGATIQFRNLTTDEWTDCYANDTPAFDTSIEYRVKPKTMIQRCRVALVRDSLLGTKTRATLVITDSQVKDDKRFVKWLSDPIEYEVEYD